MKLQFIAVLGAAILACTPFAASASTIGATTSQTTTITAGALNSITTSQQNIAGVEVQSSLAYSSTGAVPCLNACAGSTGSVVNTYTKTNFSSQENNITTFNGWQNSFNITCATTAYSDPFAP